MTDRPAAPGPLEAAIPGYSAQPRPLTAYAQIVGMYNLAFALFLAASRSAGRPMPQRLNAWDIVLLSVATFKLSRILSKDIVTSPLRAPFTTYIGPAGEGETEEKPRGEGMQLAMGELLSCPFCMGAWVAAALAYGLVLSPPLTRFLAGVLTIHAAADVLQLGYGSLAKATRIIPEEEEGK